MYVEHHGCASHMRFVQVVFIAAGKTKKEVAEYASKCPVLFVRGQEVYKWALLLAHTYKDVQGIPPVDVEVLRSYRGVNGVPECLVESAIVAGNEEEVEQLRAAHVLPRVGYAATRYGADEDPGEAWLQASIAP